VNTIGLIVAAVIIGMLLFTLCGIVRWSIISSNRTRGSAGRLRTPDPDGVAQLCGIRVPPELLDFYRNDSRVSTEALTLRGTDGREWEFGAFNPLCVPDVSEWRKVSRVPGIPFASDWLKGVYFVAGDGTVMLASPEGPATVATDVRTLLTYKEVVTCPP
jgi:hypothetical protein